MQAGSTMACVNGSEGLSCMKASGKPCDSNTTVYHQVGPVINAILFHRATSRAGRVTVTEHNDEHSITTTKKKKNRKQ